MTGRADGFSLLELMVAVAVLGLILLMLTQAGHIGGQAYTRLQHRSREPAEIEPVEHALRQMIERIDAGRFPEPPALRGGAHAFAFVTELPAVTAGADQLVNVRLEVTRSRLVLAWTPHGNGVPFGGLPAVREIVLLDQVAGVDISYAARGKAATWRSDWNMPAVPGLVRLDLRMPPGRPAWPPIIIRPTREPAEE